MQVLWGNVPSGSKSAQSGQVVRDVASAVLWAPGGCEGPSEPSQVEAMEPLHQPVLGGWSLDAERLQLGKCRGGALPGGRGLISWSLRPSGESYTKVIQKYFTYNVKYMICGIKLMATK